MLLLLKTTAAKLEFYSRFWLWPHYIQQRVVLHQQQQHITTEKPNFSQIGPRTPELWRHIPFSSWQQPRRKSTSGVRFGDVIHLRRSKTISKLSQSTPETLLFLVFGNKRPPYLYSTSGFDFELFYCHRHAILHRVTKFYVNWMISDRVMAVCRFSEIAAISSQIYFRFSVLWRLTFKKNYLHTKFWSDI